MANTYTWVVTAMNCYPQKDDNTNVVFTVHWTCAGTDGTYNTSVYNTCNIPLVQGTFTPYEDLTQDQVLGWCWANGVDKDVIEASLAQRIEMLKNPVTASGTPWTV
jgi:hypothetical protein